MTTKRKQPDSKIFSFFFSPKKKTNGNKSSDGLEEANTKTSSTPVITLWLGDCIEKMKQIPNGSVDMVCCDPPYGTTRCKWDTCLDLDRMWKELKRVTKMNGAIALFSSQPFASALISRNYDMFKQDLIWRKNTGGNPFNSKKMHMARHEIICVFYRKQPVFNRQFSYGKPYKQIHKSNHSSAIYSRDAERVVTRAPDGRRNPVTVLDFKTVWNCGRLHPTQKPVPLLEYLIKTYSNAGETVLDFTMGSGSTGVAAKKVGRAFIGIEMDEKYFNVAKERIEKTTCEN